MHKAISEQLYILTRQTISAPFVINFAVCNLENDKTKCIVKHSSIIEKDEKKAAIESVVRSIKVWCSNDDQRYTESWLEGAELGISASGKLDVRDHKFQVEGQVIPAYSINKSLLKIPIIGKLLTGGKSTGIISIDYKASGDDKFKNSEIKSIEFDAPKELLLSNKPKLIGLQFEAVLKCPNQ
ncbi:putative 2-dehydro-3-deoxy-D-pentonate aldolase YjhH [Dirofilaria immitis]